ncbi:MAG: hypothetical protein LBL76_05800 [Treponema sp.]|jgi:hypothetical protein|nr:hypothetical protein [Treponema sp.]
MLPKDPKDDNSNEEIASALFALGKYVVLSLVRGVLRLVKHNAITKNADFTAHRRKLFNPHILKYYYYKIVLAYSQHFKQY